MGGRIHRDKDMRGFNGDGWGEIVLRIQCGEFCS